jgi:hypothetical protein
MSLFNSPKPNNIDNWVCVFESGQNYEVDLARNYLSNLKIPSNILSKKDTAYSLGVGDMSHIYLYVPKDYEEKARAALNEFEQNDRNEQFDEEGLE